MRERSCRHRGSNSRGLVPLGMRSRCEGKCRTEVIGTGGNMLKANGAWTGSDRIFNVRQTKHTRKNSKNAAAVLGL